MIQATTHVQTDARSRAGDGFVQPGEACDDNNSPLDACTNQCLNARCGDGSFNRARHVTMEMHSRTMRAPMSAGSICGDGIVHTGVEACDDGNDIDTDGCTLEL